VQRLRTARLRPRRPRALLELGYREASTWCGAAAASVDPAERSASLRSQRGSSFAVMAAVVALRRRQRWWVQPRLPEFARGCYLSVGLLMPRGRAL
jgi:hypothetical protein